MNTVFSKLITAVFVTVCCLVLLNVFLLFNSNLDVVDKISNDASTTDKPPKFARLNKNSVSPNDAGKKSVSDIVGGVFGAGGFVVLILVMVIVAWFHRRGENR